MWDTVNQFIEELNKIEYVILRGPFRIDGIHEGEDLDILCRDEKVIAKKINLSPLNNNTRCFNYFTVINHKRILIDVRVIGDGYYDNKWANTMLMERKLKNGLYRLDELNYKYATLYHCLMHKKYDNCKKYKEFIISEFGTFDEKTNLTQLVEYLKKIITSLQNL